MRILFLGNNWVGWQVAKWLKEQNEQIVGLVVHSPEKQKFYNKLIAQINIDPKYIFYGSELRNIEIIDFIKALRPDIGLSIFFGYILKQEFLDLFPLGVINLHPSYLPFNRGQYPNVWSIIDGTPAGATLHYVDSGVDTGDIVSQKKVYVEQKDTGQSLYKKLEFACFELFIETWPLIKSGKTLRTKQDRNEGTYHCTSDVAKLDQINLNKSYSAMELFNIVRARTFPPYPGAYYVDNGKKVYLRLQLLEEEDL